jgi:hypothetical protein
MVLLIISDINECMLNPNICENGVCENRQMGYRCICNTGYKQDNTGTLCLGKLTAFVLLFFFFLIDLFASKLVYFGVCVYMCVCEFFLFLLFVEGKYPVFFFG